MFRGGILETGVVNEGKGIIKNQQVSNGTTNPAKCQVHESV